MVANDGAKINNAAKKLAHVKAVREWEQEMQRAQQQQPLPLPVGPRPTAVASETSARCAPDVRAALHANDPANQPPSTATEVPLKRPPPTSGRGKPKRSSVMHRHHPLGQCNQLHL